MCGWGMRGEGRGVGAKKEGYEKRVPDQNGYHNEYAMDEF